MRISSKLHGLKENTAQAARSIGSQKQASKLWNLKPKCGKTLQTSPINCSTERTSDMTNEEYFKNLAYELRWRRLPESTVAETLREVRTEATAAQSTPHELFGSEKSYAESFPKGKTASKGFWVISVSVAIAALLLLSRIVSRIVTHGESDLLTVILTLVGAVAIVFFGSIIGAMLDHRIPRDLK